MKQEEVSYEEASNWVLGIIKKNLITNSKNIENNGARMASMKSALSKTRNKFTPEQTNLWQKFIGLSDFYTLILFLMTDLSLLVKMMISTETEHEKRYAGRQITVLLNEGYKKIYHFNVRGRGKSLWIKDIKKIIDDEMPELAVEYNDITMNIQSLGTDLEDLKNDRDSFVHYFNDNTTPYDFWLKNQNLDIDSLFTKTISFTGILGRISALLIKIVNNYKEKLPAIYPGFDF